MLQIPLVKLFWENPHMSLSLHNLALKRLSKSLIHIDRSKILSIDYVKSRAIHILIVNSSQFAFLRVYVKILLIQNSTRIVVKSIINKIVLLVVLFVIAIENLFLFLQTLDLFYMAIHLLLVNQTLVHLNSLVSTFKLLLFSLHVL